MAMAESELTAQPQVAVATVDDQRQTIALLSTPSTYGPDVDEVRHIDTRSAIVFLAGDRAYKLLGQALRLVTVLFKNQRLFLEMPTQEADPHFYELIFNPLLKKLDHLDQRCVLKETKSKKLRAIVQTLH